MPGVMQKLHTARQIVKHLGVFALGRSVVLYVLQSVIVCRKAVIYAFDVAKTSEPASAQGVRFRFVDVAEVDRNVIAQNGITESVLQSQWRRKSRFFAGIADDGSLCYFSIVDQEGFTIGQRYQIAFRSDREAYVWSCYTAPAYRGRGIYGAALRSLGCELRAEGKSLLYLYVEMENDQSAKGVRKAGFVAAAEAWVYGFRSVIRRGWRLLPGPEGLPVQYIRDWDVTPVTHTGEDLPM